MKKVSLRQRKEQARAPNAAAAQGVPAAGAASYKQASASTESDAVLADTPSAVASRMSTSTSSPTPTIPSPAAKAPPVARPSDGEIPASISTRPSIRSRLSRSGMVRKAATIAKPSGASSSEDASRSRLSRSRIQAQGVKAVRAARDALQPPSETPGRATPSRSSTAGPPSSLVPPSAGNTSASSATDQPGDSALGNGSHQPMANIPMSAEEKKDRRYELFCSSLKSRRNDAKHLMNAIKTRTESSYKGLMAFFAGYCNRTEISSMCTQVDVDVPKPQPKPSKTLAEAPRTAEDWCKAFVYYVLGSKPLDFVLSVLRLTAHPYTALSEIKKNDFRCRLKLFEGQQITLSLPKRSGIESSSATTRGGNSRRGKARSAKSSEGENEAQRFS